MCAGLKWKCDYKFTLYFKSLARAERHLLHSCWLGIRHVDNSEYRVDFQSQKSSSRGIDNNPAQQDLVHNLIMIVG